MKRFIMAAFMVAAMSVLVGCGSSGDSAPSAINPNPSGYQGVADIQGTWRGGQFSPVGDVIVAQDMISIYPNGIANRPFTVIRGFYTPNGAIYKLTMNNLGGAGDYPPYVDEVSVSFGASGQTMVWRATPNTRYAALYPATFAKQ